MEVGMDGEIRTQRLGCACVGTGVVVAGEWQHVSGEMRWTRVTHPCPDCARADDVASRETLPAPRPLEMECWDDDALEVDCGAADEGCDACDGDGYHVETRETPDGEIIEVGPRRACPRCDGRGLVASEASIAACREGYASLPVDDDEAGVRAWPLSYAEARPAQPCSVRGAA
jgi:hypothetical protein